MEDTAAYKSAVNGWKQAISLLQAEHAALMWCIERMNKTTMAGGDKLAREYAEVVWRAYNASDAYLKAMTIPE